MNFEVCTHVCSIVLFWVRVAVFLATILSSLGVDLSFSCFGFAGIIVYGLIERERGLLDVLA